MRRDMLSCSGWDAIDGQEGDKDDREQEETSERRCVLRYRQPPLSPVRASVAPRIRPKLA